MTRGECISYVHLFYLTTGFCLWSDGEQRELALIVLGTQDHTLADNAAHCTWRKVCNETYLLANQFFVAQLTKQTSRQAENLATE